MDGVVEIITGRERRRRWSLRDKIRLVAETHEPGAMIRAVAARHGVSESLLFTWRRQSRQGLLAQAGDHPVFVPVQTLAPTSMAMAPLDERPCPTPASVPRSVSMPGLIEIELGNGRQVRVGSDVNLAALRRVLAALRG
ncbi:MAG: IS66-like element accessory protein TnpA [Janthinobacterium lividum]